MKRTGMAWWLTVMVVFWRSTASGQTRTAVGPFITAQARCGRAAYLSHCASCHLPDLGGRNEAAELAGSNFIRAWGTRTTRTCSPLFEPPCRLATGKSGR